MANDLNEIVELLDNAENVLPVVQRSAEALKSFGPVVKSLLMDSALGLADVRIAVIKKYEEAGYGEQAVWLMTSQWDSMIDSLKSK